MKTASTKGPPVLSNPTKGPPLLSNFWGRPGRFFIGLIARRLNQTAWMGRVLILAGSNLRAPAGRRGLIRSLVRGQFARCLGMNTPPVAILGFLTGFLWAVIWFNLLMNIGGLDTFLSIIVTVQFQEISPFITCMVALAAYMGPMILEIILMRGTGQFDALITMGIPPAHFVAWPRILGPVLAFPPLLVVNNFCTAVGALLGIWLTVDLPLGDFFHEIYLRVGVFKLFKLLLQDCLMAFTMCFFCLYSAWRFDSRDLSKAPSALRTGLIEASVFSALAGILVTVFYA